MPMKRKRPSADTKTQQPNNEERRVPGVQIQREGRSIEDLPQDNLINILSRLSVRRIINCGSVSKSWRQIISTPEFAKSHLARAQKSAWPLIRTNDPKSISRTLYLVEPEYESEFDAGQCTCEVGYNESGHVHMKLDTKFKIPLRDRKMVLYDKLNPIPNARKKRFVYLDPNDHKFNVANSCNGLVCLCEPIQNNPSIVCNPLTGEYVSLPEAPITGNTRTLILAGIGRCRDTDEYKVIRIVCESLSSEAYVHTLGTRSWRSLEGSPYSPNACKLKLPTYLNGTLHWLRVYYQGREEIESFDFETETFHSFPSRPNGFSEVGNWEDMISMGVLDGCLFICDSSKSECFGLWVMKEYGIAESWINELLVIPGIDRWPCGLYQPIKYMENGALLIFHSANYLLYFDQTKSEIKFLKLHGFQTKFEAFPHIPSFVSLKEYATEDNTLVLNVNSWCGRLDLKEEVDALFLVEEYQAIGSSDFHDTAS